MEEWVREMKLHVIAINFPPFQATEISAASLSEETLNNFKRFVVTLDKPNLDGVTKGSQVYEKNPRSLTLDVGKQTAKGLSESYLAYATDDATAKKHWKRIASDLKKFTKTGAIAFDPESGAKSLLRNHRYSEGAKRLSDAGVPILPIAGGSLLRLGEGK